MADLAGQTEGVAQSAVSLVSLSNFGSDRLLLAEPGRSNEHSIFAKLKNHKSSRPAMPDTL
jgi:hypothetical protein